MTDRQTTDRRTGDEFTFAKSRRLTTPKTEPSAVHCVRQKHRSPHLRQPAVQLCKCHYPGPHRGGHDVVTPPDAAAELASDCAALLDIAAVFRQRRPQRRLPSSFRTADSATRITERQRRCSYSCRNTADLITISGYLNRRLLHCVQLSGFRTTRHRP